MQDQEVNESGATCGVNEMIERFVELYMNKKEIMKESRAVNKELRELKPKIVEYLDEQGRNTLELQDGTQLVLSTAPKKLRKKKAEYEGEVVEYLTELGVQDAEHVFELLQEMKNGDVSIVPDLKCL